MGKSKIVETTKKYKGINKMIKIQVTSRELAERAAKIMSEEIMYNPNLNGALYEIEIGDYNEIDNIDAIVGTQLFYAIFNDKV